MAERRMLTQKIIDSDSFLELPLSSQALYMHLILRSDDDGFVNNPKKITRMIGAADDDLKLLLLKRFIIGFESGVIVIRHWRMHNTLKSDRYHPTDYQEEFAKLGIKSDKSYTDDLTENCVSALEATAKKLLPAADEQCGNSMEPEWNQNGTIVEPSLRHDGNSMETERIQSVSNADPERIQNGTSNKNKINKYKLNKNNLEEDRENNKNASIISRCSEQKTMQIALPLNDGSEYGVFDDQIAEWQQLYPAVDVMQELRNMRGWLLANTARRKTRSGIERFVNAWLAREQDKGTAAAPRNKTIYGNGQTDETMDDRSSYDRVKKLLEEMRERDNEIG